MTSLITDVAAVVFMLRDELQLRREPYTPLTDVLVRTEALLAKALDEATKEQPNA